MRSTVDWKSAFRDEASGAAGVAGMIVVLDLTMVAIGLAPICV